MLWGFREQLSSTALLHVTPHLVELVDPTSEYKLYGQASVKLEAVANKQSRIYSESPLTGTSLRNVTPGQRACVHPSA